jgi:hypothetical protein
MHVELEFNLVPAQSGLPECCGACATSKSSTMSYKRAVLCFYSGAKLAASQQHILDPTTCVYS